MRLVQVPEELTVQHQHGAHQHYHPAYCPQPTRQRAPALVVTKQRVETQRKKRSFCGHIILIPSVVLLSSVTVCHSDVGLDCPKNEYVGLTIKSSQEIEKKNYLDVPSSSWTDEDLLEMLEQTLRQIKSGER